MKNRFAYWMILAAALGISPLREVHAAPIYSTLGPGGTFDTSHFVQIGSSPIVLQAGIGAYADEFTSPVAATVGSVTLALAIPIVPLAAATPDLQGLNINIRAITPIGPRGPTNIVGSFGPGNISQAGLYTFTATTAFHLDAGTEYWLFVGVPQGGPIDWFLNNQSIDNVTGSRSLGTWTVNGSGTAPAFELDTVPEPGSAGLCAITFVVTYLWRKRIFSRWK